MRVTAVMTGALLLLAAGLAGATGAPQAGNPAAPAPGPGVAVVLNSLDDTVSLIDMAGYREIRRVPIGKEPHHLLGDPDSDAILIANTMSNDLAYLDPRTGTVTRRVSRISDPYQIGFSPDRRWFVSASLRLDRVDVYRYGKGEYALEARLPLGRAPSHLAFTSRGDLAFITLQDSNEVVAIEPQTRRERWRVSAGPAPAGIFVTSDDRHVMTGLTGTDVVDVREAATGKPVVRLTTGAGAHNFLPLGDGRRVLLSNRVASVIAVIDQRDLKVLETFPVPGGPDCMDLRAGGRELWVTSRWINRVSVIDMVTRRVVRTIPVGRSPHGIFLTERALPR